MYVRSLPTPISCSLPSLTTMEEFREGLFSHVASYTLPMFSPLRYENIAENGRVGEEGEPQTPHVETVKRLFLNDYHSS